MTITLNSRITRFRVRVHKWRAYFCKHIYSLPMYERPGIGTMCVDRYSRCYYDPAFVEKIDEDQGAYTLMHESLHVLLRHFDQVIALIGRTPSEKLRHLANIAADIVVEQMLRGGGLENHKPCEVHTYEMHGFPPRLTLTEYYRLLVKESEQKEQREKQRQQSEPEDDGDEEEEDEQPDDSDDSESESGDENSEDDGDESDDSQPSGEGDDESEEEFDPDTDDGDSGDDYEGDESDDGGEGDGPEQDSEGDESDDGGEGDGEPDDDAIPGTGEGGSCCDGVPREYELPPDPTWDSHREDGVLKEMESRVVEYEKTHGAGSVPAGIKAQFEVKLHPQPDPWDQLRSAVSSSVASPIGAPSYTYQRPSRRQQKGGPILKGKRSTQPKAVVILDTSGSMCCGDDKIRALNVIQQGLSRLRSVRVIAGDTQIQGDKRVNKIMDVEWVGCGGTAMDRIIEDVDRTMRPDSIILITDGQTAWPRRKPNARVVVALTRKLLPQYPFPVWARGIQVGGA
jgi:predicted metal-dependent peptidase